MRRIDARSGNAIPLSQWGQRSGSLRGVQVPGERRSTKMKSVPVASSAAASGEQARVDQAVRAYAARLDAATAAMQQV